MTATATPFTATYRLQLHRGFTLDDAAAAVPYLADLGVSHLYLAPILTAVPGSLHGYDVLDHTAINPELGGREALERLAERAHRAGLGIAVDIVPNHMALVDPQWRNAPLWDVLTHGRNAAHAHWFDVDWDHLDGRFGLPLLGGSLADELAAGSLTVEVGRPDEGPASGQPVLRYYDHVLPLRPDGPDTDDLAELLAAQHWLLASHTEAAQVLNYRRFFEVDQLVAVRVEEPDVFDATHALLLDLHHAGVIDAFRVDHPDGLADPEGYLARLAAGCRPGTPIWVEKILEGDERLPAWACHGTTGYDAAAVLGTALVDPGTVPAVSEAWAATGGEPSLEVVTEASKRQVLAQLLQPELNRLHRAAVSALPDLDATLLRAALAELLVQLHVYRAYVTPGVEPDADLVEPLRAALRRAVATRPDLAETATALARVLERPETATGDAAAASDLCVRFQQTTGPVMAKGIEDTTFYRWHRLVALNEVGADPATGEHPGVAELHAWATHQAAHWPLGLTTLSTHDTKRSEDVRARLLALAGDETAWRRLSALGREASARHGVDAATGHLVWQTVAGATPLTTERLQAYLTKALREGKQRTSWLQPDDDYEQRVQALGAEALAGSELATAIAEAVEAAAEPIRTVTLAQKLVQLTLPGVPDTYQGAELLNLTLVDPDNRSDVDVAASAERLAALDAGAEPRDLADEILLVTSRVLRVRRARPDAFATGYAPVDLGPELLAFRRGEQLLVVVRRLAHASRPDAVALPPGDWQDLLTATAHSGSTGTLFDTLPVALLAKGA
ncbi:malto-oligosyltrehalose synthase [Micropruina sonneratiae]|uniref:malto-oligosyltrehalose synthase n=1 Tax=Micropruina sonneratiae TaxID=2986940 RepID=UPI002225E977|nr:malto-oligosyltrehalose synthase [Micropruina sp. KQZ13P-5]MCW3156815.1 malto-oligosyltrehalose synthase [Micropruina sp. KQZ13P-5]